MPLLAGVYRFNPKIVGFRSDFCLSCDVPRLAYRIRTLAVLHFFFIPLLPLGYWKRWQCVRCGQHPHAQPNLRKVWQWAIVAILTFVVVGAWLIPTEGELSVWFSRLAIPPLLIFLLRYAWKSKSDVRLKDKLQNVLPDQAGCPICGHSLVLKDGWRCPGCGIKRLSLRLT